MTVTTVDTGVLRVTSGKESAVWDYSNHSTSFIVPKNATFRTVISFGSSISERSSPTAIQCIKNFTFGNRLMNLLPFSPRPRGSWLSFSGTVAYIYFPFCLLYFDPYFRPWFQLNNLPLCLKWSSKSQEPNQIPETVAANRIALEFAFLSDLNTGILSKGIVQVFELQSLDKSFNLTFFADPSNKMCYFQISDRGTANLWPKLPRDKPAHIEKVFSLKLSGSMYNNNKF
jgi:hypothetical protein